MKFSNDEEKATEREKNFRALFGGNKEKEEKYVKLYKERKGKTFDFFNDNNTLKVNKEEVIKKLDKTSSTTKKVNLPIVVETHVETHVETLSRLVTEKNEWDFSSIEENEKALEKVIELKTIIEGKKEASIEKSIKALEKTINDATKELKKLKGEDQSKPTTEAEQKEGEAEAAN